MINRMLMLIRNLNGGIQYFLSSCLLNNWPWYRSFKQVIRVHREGISRLESLCPVGLIFHAHAYTQNCHESSEIKSFGFQIGR